MTEVMRGPIALIRDRTYGRYFTGKLVSSIGIWSQNIAAVIVMWDLTGSAFLVGAVSVTQFLGPLLLAPWTGAMSDRFDRRHLLMLGRAISGIAAAILAGTGFLGRLSPGLLLGSTLLLGVGLAITSPAMHALVTSLLPPQDWEQGIALNAVVQNIARAIGPAIGSVLLLTGGPAAAFGFAALGHWAFAAAVFSLQVDATAKGPRGRVFDGFRHLRGDRPMRLLLVGVAALGFGADPVVTLTPALVETLGRGESAVGMLASAFGLGALVAAAAMRRIRTRVSLPELGAYGFYALGAGMGLAALSPVFFMTLPAFALAGAGFLTATTTLTTRIQREVPEILRGRVMAIWTVAFLGSRPIAAAVNGSVADLTSVAVALSVAAGVCLAASRITRLGAPAQDGSADA